MIQNKNKLREVGLEPDKPKGYIRGIWALTLILAFALIVAGGIYFILWSSPWGENVSVNKSQGTPSSTATLSGSPLTSSQSATKYETYINSNLSKFSFEYPENLYVLPEGFTGEHQGSGTVKILKKGNDNLLTPTKIEVTVSKMSQLAADIRVVYKLIYNSDLTDDSLRKVTDATVGGVIALKVTATDVEDMGYYFIQGDYFYSITAYMSRVDEDKSPLADKDNKAAFDHLVSSFKFQ